MLRNNCVQNMFRILDRISITDFCMLNSKLSNAYGRNLTDEITKVAFFASDAIVGSPRQVGISLTARF